MIVWIVFPTECACGIQCCLLGDVVDVVAGRRVALLNGSNCDSRIMLELNRVHWLLGFCVFVLCVPKCFDSIHTRRLRFVYNTECYRLCEYIHITYTSIEISCVYVCVVLSVSWSNLLAVVIVMVCVYKMVTTSIRFTSIFCCIYFVVI